MRCLALFTGGLDSQIAVQLMQRQGIEVEGVFVASSFSCHTSLAAAMHAAKKLQINLHLGGNSSQMLSMVRQPRFGYSQEMAPCLDCRSAMVRSEYSMLKSLDASFIITGDVVGQRPSSLRSRDFETIDHHGGAEDLVLRPLSAKLLPPTLPERLGWVDREQLFDWHGKGRKQQIQLAREWGLVEPEGHYPGCYLLEPTYAARLRRLLEIDSNPSGWQLATLKFGRHFWRNDQAHLVVTRNAEEGESLIGLHRLAARDSVLFEPLNFRGPLAVLTGKIDDATINDAANVIAQFSKEIVPLQSAVKLIGWTASSALITQAPAADGTRRFVGFTE